VAKLPLNSAAPEALKNAPANAPQPSRARSLSPSHAKATFHLSGVGGGAHPPEAVFCGFRIAIEEDTLIPTSFDRIRGLLVYSFQRYVPQEQGNVKRILLFFR